MTLPELYFFAKSAPDYDTFMIWLTELAGICATDDRINNIELHDLCNGTCKKINDLAEVLKHNKCKCLNKC